jgi:hypothetical protein
MSDMYRYTSRSAGTETCLPCHHTQATLTLAEVHLNLTQNSVSSITISNKKTKQLMLHSERAAVYFKNPIKHMHKYCVWQSGEALVFSAAAFDSAGR